MKNIIPHNLIYKFFNLSIALMISSTSLYAHTIFSKEDMVVLTNLFYLILFFVFSIILRLFRKNNTLIYASLSLFILFNLWLFIKNIPDDYKIKSRHYFQEPNTYGVYEGNKTIVGTENLNVIYMTEPYNNNIPDLLDNNKTIYLHDLALKIHVNELNKVIYFNKYGNNLNIFGDEYENTASMVSYRSVSDNRKIIDYTYDEDSTNYQLFRFNDSIDEYKKYKKINRSYDNIEFNDTTKLKNAFLNYEPIVLMDKRNKQLRLFKRGNKIQFRAFSVPYTPKIALYHSSYHHRDGDKIFIVYEELKGVYILENINTKEYIHLQNILKELINTSTKSYELLSTLKTHILDSEQLDKLREILMRKPSITYNYHVDISKNQAYVYVSSDDFPLLHIIFILTKAEQWTISDILYKDPEYLNILGNW